MASKVETAIHSSYGVLSVAIAAAVTHAWGEGGRPQVAGAALSAIAIFSADLSLEAARRRSALVRNVLDDRSFLEGVWVQGGHRNLNVGSSEPEKRFSFFQIGYSGPLDTYTLEGTAYGERGHRQSKWRANEKGLHLSVDHQSASYTWTGEVIGGSGTSDRRREGTATLTFSPRRDSGEAELRTTLGSTDAMTFSFEKVTEAWLRRHAPEATARLSDLANLSSRDEVAEQYAARFARWAIRDES